MKYFKDTEEFIKNKKVFCGIDVHKSKWNLCFFSDGEMIERMQINSDYHRLLTHLHTFYHSASSVKLVYEAGFTGFWLCRKLRKAGYHCIVTPPNRVPKTEGKVKTDKRDAAKLTRYLCSGILKEVYLPPESIEADRRVERHRLSFVKKKTRIQNQIKSFLYLHDVQRPDFIKRRWSKAYMQWLEALKFDHTADRFVLERMFSNYHHIRDELAAITRQLRRLSRTEPYYKNFKRLTACKGVGLVTAMTYLLELHDLTRFPSADKLSSYLGMTSSQHSSGEKVRLGHITREGNVYARRCLVESAWTVIRFDPHLREKYNRIRAKGTNGKKAIVAVARSLALRLRRCLLDEVPYEVGIC